MTSLSESLLLLLLPQCISMSILEQLEWGCVMEADGGEAGSQSVAGVLGRLSVFRLVDDTLKRFVKATVASSKLPRDDPLRG